MEDNQAWLKSLAQRAKSRLEREQLKDRTFIEEQELKRRHGPVLWDDLKTHLKESIGTANVLVGQGEVYKYTEDGADKVTVEFGKKPSRALLRFEEKTLKLTLTTGSTISNCEVVVNAGHVVWDSPQISRRDSQQLARYILDEITKPVD